MAEDTKQKAIRPTKKQKELLSFIENFIAGNGYSPSYREIMKSLDYNSVATVALHVNSLIKRGHLRKRDRSARSLEVVKGATLETKPDTDEAHKKWLAGEVDKRLVKFTKVDEEDAADLLEDLEILNDALEVLGMKEQASKFREKLDELAEEREA